MLRNHSKNTARASARTTALTDMESFGSHCPDRDHRPIKGQSQPDRNRSPDPNMGTQKRQPVETKRRTKEGLLRASIDGDTVGAYPVTAMSCGRW